MATKLQEAEKEYSQERIQYAFREASENDARTWRYVEAVLKGKGPTKRDTRGPADDGEAEWLQRRYERGCAGERSEGCQLRHRGRRCHEEAHHPRPHK